MTLAQAKKAVAILGDEDEGLRIIKDGEGGYKVYDFDTNQTWWDLWEVTNPGGYTRTPCDGPSDADSGL